MLTQSQGKINRFLEGFWRLIDTRDQSGELKRGEESKELKRLFQNLPEELKAMIFEQFNEERDCMPYKGALDLALADDKGNVFWEAFLTFSEHFKNRHKTLFVISNFTSHSVFKQKEPNSVSGREGRSHYFISIPSKKLSRPPNMSKSQLLQILADNTASLALPCFRLKEHTACQERSPISLRLTVCDLSRNSVNLLKTVQVLCGCKLVSSLEFRSLVCLATVSSERPEYENSSQKSNFRFFWGSSFKDFYKLIQDSLGNLTKLTLDGTYMRESGSDKIIVHEVIPVLDLKSLHCLEVSIPKQSFQICGQALLRIFRKKLLPQLRTWIISPFTDNVHISTDKSLEDKIQNMSTLLPGIQLIIKVQFCHTYTPSREGQASAEQTQLAEIQEFRDLKMQNFDDIRHPEDYEGSWHLNGKVDVDRTARSYPKVIYLKKSPSDEDVEQWLAKG